MYNIFISYFLLFNLFHFLKDKDKIKTNFCIVS